MFHENKRVTRNNSDSGRPANFLQRRGSILRPPMAITKAAPVRETNKLRRNPGDSIFAFGGVRNGAFSEPAMSEA
jgi:hypothetical protein